ncbi:hypothetical protein AD998_03220 [bacterium 336/3]|nr:hypothetical protein AD998_03220 [bacterium 336/3]
MLFKYILIFHLLIYHYSFSQNCFQDAWGLEKLKFGYSTTYDAEQVLGKGFLTFNTLRYDNGISLIFNENQILESLILTKPFKGSFRNGFHIILDSSNIEEVAQSFPDHVADLTHNAQHCSLKTSLDSFNIEFQASSIKISGIIEYKDYSLQKINISPKVHYFLEKKEREDSYCEAPLYAPENETHLNCWVFEYSGGLMGHLEPVEQGIHKYYRLNHKLESEGNFNRGERTGIWKYYDDNGKLINTKEHFNFPANSLFFSLFLISLFLIFYISLKKS